MEVHKELGFGFLENVYEKALLIVLREKGLSFQKQCRFDVRFRDHVIGDFLADLIIENCVLVELKAVSTLRPEFEAQIINYLKATGIRVGLLVNFGRPQLEWKRYIF